MRLILHFRRFVSLVGMSDLRIRRLSIVKACSLHPLLIRKRIRVEEGEGVLTDRRRWSVFAQWLGEREGERREHLAWSLDPPMIISCPRRLFIRGRCFWSTSFSLERMVMVVALDSWSRFVMSDAKNLFPNTFDGIGCCRCSTEVGCADLMIFPECWEAHSSLQNDDDPVENLGRTDQCF